MKAKYILYDSKRETLYTFLKRWNFKLENNLMIVPTGIILTSGRQSNLTNIMNASLGYLKKNNYDYLVLQIS